MNKVSRSKIASLIETEDSITLSLFLPTHRFPTSEHITEDTIRLKNLVKAGREALKGRGADDATIEQITSSIEETISDNESFWQGTTEAVAIFCSPAGCQYMHLPMECDEYVHVDDHYDITPLLAALSCDQPYYILALAAHHPVLYRGDMYGVDRVLITLPESAESALGIDELHSNSQTVRAGGFGAGNPGVKSHGQGDSRQAGQEERLKYYRIIDEMIMTSSEVDNEKPLLLAGTDDEISGYRESSNMRHLLSASLGGNHTETPTRELHVLAWPLVEAELLTTKRSESIEKLQSLLGTGKASNGADDISRAAEEGRIDTLLIGVLTTTRDTIEESETPKIKMMYSGDDASVMARDGRATFDRGGEVLAVFREQLSNDQVVCAIYRY